MRGGARLAARGVGARGGLTLLETLVALLLSALLIALVLGVLARQRALLANLAARADRLAAVRLTRHVLLTEARHAAGDSAWAAGADSFALRAFRGHALVCPASGVEHELRVVAEGVRAPDPTKDSILVLLSTGRVQALGLLDRNPSADPCLGTVEPTERWTLSERVPPGTLAARWFEHGTYYLAGGALRYRRGQAGRQPLTPEVLSPQGTGFRPGARSVGILLRLEPAPASREAWSFSMRLSLSGG